MSEIFLRLTNEQAERLREQALHSGGEIVLMHMVESGEFQVGISPGWYARPDGSLRLDEGTLITETLKPGEQGYKLHYVGRNLATGKGGLATVADFATMEAWHPDWQEAYHLAAGKSGLEQSVDDAGAA